jgi:hypothetical protein
MMTELFRSAWSNVYVNSFVMSEHLQVCTAFPAGTTRTFLSRQVEPRSCYPPSVVKLLSYLGHRPYEDPLSSVHCHKSLAGSS